jgi:hypothetical protein
VTATPPPARGPAHVDDADLGFAWRPAKDGAVTIVRNGRMVTVLRGAAAGDFLAEVQGAARGAAQQLMARVTGNYRRGNERTAARHPRNGGGAR